MGTDKASCGSDRTSFVDDTFSLAASDKRIKLGFGKALSH